jgi:hypothetical protein
MGYTAQGVWLICGHSVIFCCNGWRNPKRQSTITDKKQKAMMLGAIFYA